MLAAIGRDQQAQDDCSFTDRNPDHKIDKRPGCPAEERDGIA
jgi:hypothetical protein